MQAGFNLFPCRSYDADFNTSKRPAHQDWQEEKYAPADLPDMFGVVLPHDIVVIDYDPRRDPDGSSSLRALWDELNLPPTDSFITRTGSGGYHVYFRKPVDLHVRGKCPGYPAIDIKSSGGFVVGAGSCHSTGATYDFERGTPGHIKTLPGPLLDKIRLLRSQGPETQTGVISDDPDTVRRFITYCLHNAATAVAGDGGDRQTYLTACMGKDFGLSESAALDVMLEFYNPRCSPPWADDELEKKVANAYQYAQNKTGYLNAQTAFAGVKIDVATTPAGDPPTGSDAKLSESLASAANNTVNFTWTLDKQTGQRKYDPTINNVISFFHLLPTADHENDLYKLLRFNDFAGAIEFTRPAPWHRDDKPNRELTDTDLVMMKEYFTHKHLHVSVDTIREACIVLSQENAYHPLKDWLLSLKWDGVPRLDRLLVDYAGAPDSPYVKEVGKNTILAAVARAFIPGCQHDHMLILEGRQGTRKSSFVRVLGGRWYADIQIDPNNKETVQNMQSCWILEASEMEFIRRSDVAALKRFITLVSDRIMKKYDRLPSTMPRQCIFIGTINPGKSGYFQDVENRRFWPVVTGKIDTDKLARDRDQIFAEAVHRFKQGEKWYIVNPVIEAIARQEQQDRQIRDEWGDVILEWLATASQLPTDMTTKVVALHALNLTASKLDWNTSRRINEVMCGAGYKQVKKKLNGQSIRVWEKPGDDCAWL